MADIYSGYKRSLKCYVSKKLNGVVADGYPKLYPTATDVSNGYFTYDAIQYDIPTPAELSNMSQATYDSLLATFKLYVESIESGASFATDTIVEPTLYDPSGCAVEIPTTTTTTTTVLEPEATYEITSNGSGYGASQTVFTVTGATIGDIVTIRVIFTGYLQKDTGYTSTRVRVYILYPEGSAQSLSACFSDSILRSIGTSKEVSFIAPSSSFTITTDAYKINSSNIDGTFRCEIRNVQRDSVDYTLTKIAMGKFYKSLEPTFSC